MGLTIFADGTPLPPLKRAIELNWFSNAGLATCTGCFLRLLELVSYALNSKTTDRLEETDLLCHSEYLKVFVLFIGEL